MSEALPGELVVTNLQVQWATNLWKVHLSGNLQTTGQPTTPTTLTTLTNAVGVLADRLANGPFHLKILHRSDQPDPAATAENRPARYNGKVVLANNFAIDGVMK